MKVERENTLTRTGKSTLYGTSNQQYGTVWTQNTQTPELTLLRKDTVPTYSQIGGSIQEYRKAERLIKNKVIKETLDREGVDPHSQNIRYQKSNQFHAIKGYNDYPTHGLNVGNPLYHTNNMNYGGSKPAGFQIQQKYFPCNSNFSRAFNGGPFKFTGLNTVKTVSQVHNNLNDI